MTTALPVVDEGFDPASRSLSDALRVSFKILKLVMILVVILFLCSGFFTVEQNQEALVLRFGQLVAGGDGSLARGPGFKVALPEPVDEKVHVRTDTRTIVIESFGRGAGQTGAYMQLHPGVHGYMIMADRNLVHAMWTIQYEVTDSVTFISRVADAESADPNDNNDHGGAGPLIEAALENAVVHTAAAYTSSDILLQRADDFRREVRDRVRDHLADYGIDVLDIVPKGQPVVPGRVRNAWAARTTAAQTRAQQIKRAESEYTSTLNDAAGAVYPDLLDRLADYEKAKGGGDTAAVAATEKEIRRIMLAEAGGETAKRIGAAKGFKTEVEQSVRADVRRFEELLPEYEKNPETLVSKLWTETRTKLLSMAEGKLYPVPGWKLVIEVHPDERWKREDESKALLREAGGGE